MKRILLCMTIIFILFGGLSFFVTASNHEINMLETGTPGHKEGHMQTQASVSMQDACELRSVMELQLLLRTMPGMFRETRTQATFAGCGLLLLLAICSALLNGGRKSSLISILYIRLAFWDGMLRKLCTIYQMDGKKRRTLCL